MMAIAGLEMEDGHFVGIETDLSQYDSDSLALY